MKTNRALVLLFGCLNVCFIATGQDLGNIRSQKPFTWHGSVGASFNFYSSTEPVYTQPPYAWNIYGNFTGTVYGVSLPVSFLVNQYGKSYTNPFTQFGISPTYKWAKLHLGYRNIVFSPLTYEGQSFKGAGVELTPGILRFAAFAGRLNKAVNEDTSSGRLKMPQYSRKGYGFKIGVGKEANYIDLIYFSAKDDSSSSNVLNKFGPVRPQENAVLGTSVKITMLKKIVLTADAAMSGLTQDMAYGKDSTEGSLSKLFDKLLTTNSSTVHAWAGQALLQVNLGKVQSNIGYRRVQPDFKSLGTPYMVNDIQAFSLANNFSLSKGKLNIATMIGTQHNNLNHKLSSQLNTTTGNININTMVSPKFTFNVNATGYALNQEDGTTKLKDSFRLKQQVYQISISPVYIIAGTNANSTLSSNVTIGGLNDRNPATSPFSNNKNFSASLTASRYLIKRGFNYSLTGLHNRFKQGSDLFTSTGITAGGGAQLLKEKNLSLQATLGYLFNNYKTAKAGGNITFSFNAGYRAAKHSFNAFTNYLITTPGSFIPTPDKVPYGVMTKNFAGGLSYTYSF